MDNSVAKSIDLPRQAGANGELVVLQAVDGAVPFPISRVFMVRAASSAQRGRHAHKRCNQFMVCTYGRCEVTCSDGLAKQTFMLDALNRGLLVPSGIWAEQHYLDRNNVLMVLCDRPYEENDYIRDYQEFLAFRKQSATSR